MPKIVNLAKFPVKQCCQKVSFNRTKIDRKCQWLKDSNDTFWVVFKDCAERHSLGFLPEFWSYLLLAAVFNLEPKLDRVVSLVVGLEGALLQGGLAGLALVFFLGDFLIGESDSFLLGELLLVAGREVSIFSDMVSNTNQAYFGYSLDNFLEDVEPFESCL